MPAQAFDCTVTRNESLTETVFEVSFRPNEGRIDFKAGQFVSIVVPGAGPNGKDLRRAYSVCSPPESDEVLLCVKLVEGGPGTNFLKGLKEGDSLKCFAPYGSFVYKTEPGRHVCFIATGTGIAPFRSMVESNPFCAAPPESVMFLFGASYEDEILYDQLLGERSGTRWVSCVSRPKAEWAGYTGRVTQYLRDGMDADFPWGQTDFYLCGNGAMIKEVKAWLMEEKGLDKSAIHCEIYFNPKKTESNS